VTGPVMLRLDLTPQATAGQPVAGRLELTNTASEPFSAASPLSPAASSILVFDRLWNPVPPEAVGKVHVAHEVVELAPGETRTFELTDLAYVGATAGLAHPLRPGLYFVLAIYHPPTDRLPERSEFPIAVSSNVVRLEVVES
jgi:hypothetical protein